MCSHLIDYNTYNIIHVEAQCVTVQTWIDPKKSDPNYLISQQSLGSSPSILGNGPYLMLFGQ